MQTFIKAESLAETGIAHPASPNTASQGRWGVRVFGRSKPHIEPSDSERVFARMGHRDLL